MNRRFFISLLITVAILAVRLADGRIPNIIPVITPTGPLRVLLVEDQRFAGEMPESQRQIFLAPELDAHVAKLSGKIYVPPAGTDAANATPEWRALFGRPRTGTPWLLVARGETVTYEGKLPLTLDETLKLIK